jgi:hypothetical protein
VNHFAARHWHAVACKQGFGLVFVDLHLGVWNGNSNIAQTAGSASRVERRK